MLFPFEVFNSERQQGLSHPIKLVVKRSKSNIFCRFQYFYPVTFHFCQVWLHCNTPELDFLTSMDPRLCSSLSILLIGRLDRENFLTGVISQKFLPPFPCCSPPPQVRSIHETSLPFTSHPAHAPCSTYAVSYSLQPHTPLQGAPRTPAHWVTMSMYHLEYVVGVMPNLRSIMFGHMPGQVRLPRYDMFRHVQVA